MSEEWTAGIELSNLASSSPHATYAKATTCSASRILYSLFNLLATVSKIFTLIADDCRWTYAYLPYWVSLFTKEWALFNIISFNFGNLLVCSHSWTILATSHLLQFPILLDPLFRQLLRCCSIALQVLRMLRRGIYVSYMLIVIIIFLLSIFSIL